MTRYRNDDEFFDAVARGREPGCWPGMTAEDRAKIEEKRAALIASGHLNPETPTPSVPFLSRKFNPAWLK